MPEWTKERGTHEVSNELEDKLDEVSRYGISSQLASSGDMTSSFSVLGREQGIQRAEANAIREEVEKGYLTNEEAIVKIDALTESFVPGQTATWEEGGYYLPGVGTYLTVRDARANGWDPLSIGFVALSVAGDVATFFIPGVRGAITVPIKAGAKGTAWGATKVTPQVAKKVIASTKASVGSGLNVAGTKLSKLNINTANESIAEHAYRVKVDDVPITVSSTATDISSYGPKSLYTPLSQSLAKPLTLGHPAINQTSTFTRTSASRNLTKS